MAFLFLPVSWFAAAQTPPAVNGTWQECEANGNCGTLTFEGRRGTGHWSNGAIATLTVDRYEADTIVFRRSDTSGPVLGLTATYTGSIKGNHVEGNVSWIWPGHVNGTQNVAWSATLGTDQAQTTKPSASITPSGFNQGVFLSKCSPLLAGLIGQRDSLDAMIKTPEPPTHATPNKFDLTGDWGSLCYWNGGNVVAEDYRIEQVGEVLKVVATMPGWSRNGEVMFHGAYLANPQIKGQGAFAAGFDPSKVPPSDDTLVVDNPDNIHFAKSGKVLFRVSVLGAEDAVCDQPNTPKVKAGFARERALRSMYVRKNMTMAACWFHAAAIQGDADSEGLLAALDLQAPKPDYKEAVDLAFKSAFADGIFGKNTLAVMFQTGQGLSRTLSYARYWMEAARTSPGSLVHLPWTEDSLMNVHPSTAGTPPDAIPAVFLLAHPAKPVELTAPVKTCEPAKATATTPSEALRFAQTAFGAKSFPLAACWAFVAATQGNLDAQLDIAWFFRVGLGVDRNSRASHFWYNKAASKGDMYAEARLTTDFVVYGMNYDLAAYTAQQAPGGMYNKVMADPLGPALMRQILSDTIKRTPAAEAETNDLMLSAGLSLFGLFTGGESCSTQYDDHHGYIVHGTDSGCEARNAQRHRDKIAEEKRSAELQEICVPSRPVAEPEELKAEEHEVYIHLHPEAGHRIEGCATLRP